MSSAAQFAAPVEMPVELQSFGGVTQRAENNSSNEELLKPSGNQLSDLVQTAKVGSPRQHQFCYLLFAFSRLAPLQQSVWSAARHAMCIIR